MIVRTNSTHPVKMFTEGVVVEDEALAQLDNVSSLPFIFKHVAVMPDAHWGNGACVGSVIPTRGAIIPAAVGVDLGCVDSETEFLTRTGWKRISEYSHEEILVYDLQFDNAWFERPIDIIDLPSDGFFELKTKYGVNQMLSAEHRILFWRTRGRQRTLEASVLTAAAFAEEHNKLAQGIKGFFKTGFNLVEEEELPLTDIQLRIMVMVMADGHFPSSSKNVVLRFKKMRKIERARALLEAANIPFRIRKTKDNSTTISFTAPLREKSFSALWRASPQQLRVITSECLYWDGNVDDRVFFTRDKASADFMHYAWAAVGYRSVLRCDRHKRDNELDYRVFAYLNPFCGIAGSPKSQIVFHLPRENERKYCFRTSTGFWIMRRGGNICITGNCGMVAQRTTLNASDLPDALKSLRDEIERSIPHGGPGVKGSWDESNRYGPPGSVSTQWRMLEPGYNEIIAKHPKISKGATVSQLGSLGTGNHFIEICLDEANQVWVMLHSGSRGVGNRIGMYFIEKAKEDMRRYFINLPDQNLAYLAEGSEHFADYVRAVKWAQGFAFVNRKLMLERAISALRNHVKPFQFAETAVNCHHNYISHENHFNENIWVTRKGAVSAQKDELGIIPGSMGAKSFIVRGKGNADSFTSCSHGAGRAMSRTAAKKKFTVEDHIKATEGVECRKDVDVIDETPGAYKNIDAVMEAQKDLVEVVHTLKAVLCVKG